jgi:hypothetical protein
MPNTKVYTDFKATHLERSEEKNDAHEEQPMQMGTRATPLIDIHMD